MGTELCCTRKMDMEIFNSKPKDIPIILKERRKENLKEISNLKSYMKDSNSFKEIFSVKK